MPLPHWTQSISRSPMRSQRSGERRLPSSLFLSQNRWNAPARRVRCTRGRRHSSTDNTALSDAFEAIAEVHASLRQALSGRGVEPVSRSAEASAATPVGCSEPICSQSSWLGLARIRRFGQSVCLRSESTQDHEEVVVLARVRLHKSMTGAACAPGSPLPCPLWSSVLSAVECEVVTPAGKGVQILARFGPAQKFGRESDRSCMRGNRRVGPKPTER